MKVLTILHDLQKREVISAVEVEFVRFLNEVESEVKDEILWISAACIHAQRNGHVCLDLNNWTDEWLFGDKNSGIALTKSLKEKWLEALKNSSLVTSGNKLRPLVLENGRVYLHRFWSYEEELCKWLRKKAAVTHEIPAKSKQVLQSLLPPEGDLFKINWQHIAVQLSFLKDLVVITGGPGTGKTFTVLNIIAAQSLSQTEEKLRIALAAPTGKAARRLTESIESGISNLTAEFQKEVVLPKSAVTVHKLLGADYRGASFKYNKENPLPYDLIVVDEASMLDIAMWVRLIRALGEQTKLIVLGDKDQLASVEAGSILGDICRGGNEFSQEINNSIKDIQGANVPLSEEKPAIHDCIVFLTKSYRFGEESGIQKFANLVNASETEKAIEVLKDSRYADLNWLKPTSENLNSIIDEYAVKHHEFFSTKKPTDRLHSSSKRRILCALRKGPFGIEQLNAKSEKQIKRKNSLLLTTEWYDGRMVMATRNDTQLKVKNGDIGLYKNRKGEEGIIEFEGLEKKEILANRLNDYEPAFAMTIHKSQGSEFDEVAIILPTQVNSVLSKEILYTAVTRARQNTLIIGSEEVLKETISRSVSRKSGIKQKLWGH